ncbi:CLUMA_CG012416, isoform A [Clunio marinus]|uniref:CLUMA_CG012416, isoform A n=1 Tax=Clunio marinus TaxID=568069 RepID=A0A1J1IES4_9DIPT|nr:CLUMA_CG012416, isoform A [Clunio marinus]
MIVLKIIDTPQTFIAHADSHVRSNPRTTHAISIFIYAKGSISYKDDDEQFRCHGNLTGILRSRLLPSHRLFCSIRKIDA